MTRLIKPPPHPQHASHAQFGQRHPFPSSIRRLRTTHGVRLHRCSLTCPMSTPQNLVMQSSLP